MKSHRPPLIPEARGGSTRGRCPEAVGVEPGAWSRGCPRAAMGRKQRQGHQPGWVGHLPGCRGHPDKSRRVSRDPGSVLGPPSGSGEHGGQITEVQRRHTSAGPSVPTPRDPGHSRACRQKQEQPLQGQPGASTRQSPLSTTLGW